MTRALTNAKLIFVLMKHGASLVVRFLFSAIFSDSRLKNMLHSRLMPPKHEKTNDSVHFYPVQLQRHGPLTSTFFLFRASHEFLQDVWSDGIWLMG